MKANPGGVIDPAHVYGRDGLIAELWRQLDQTCVLMNAERRIGKTSVLRKMAQDGALAGFPSCSTWNSSIRRKNSRSRSMSRFRNILSRWKRFANAARKIYEEHEFEQFKRRAAHARGRNC